MGTDERECGQKKSATNLYRLTRLGAVCTTKKGTIGHFGFTLPVGRLQTIFICRRFQIQFGVVHVNGILI